MKSWYVIQTKPRLEAQAQENLARQGLEVYMPQCRVRRRRRGRWVTAIEPLFPRYLFLSADLSVTNTSSVRSTRGAVGFVKFGGEPCALAQRTIDLLRAREDALTGLHDIGQHRFSAGDNVTVVEGPFAGLDAVFVTDNGDERVILLLNWLGRANKIVVARDAVIAAA